MKIVIIIVALTILLFLLFLLLKNDYIRFSRIEDFRDEMEDRIEQLEENFPEERALIDELNYWKKRSEKLF